MTRLRLLVFGANGQVGRALAGRAAAGAVPALLLGRDAVDLCDAGAVDAAVAGAGPVVVVNAAAYTAVDRAEAEPVSAFAVNRDGAAAVAAACARAGRPLIHLSTDFVFDGVKTGGYREADATRPLNAYGASKEAGEVAVRTALDAHVILRVAWLFGPHRDNFVRSILRAGASRPELRVVDDQFGGPTAAADVAAAVVQVARHLAVGAGRYGTFHYCGAPGVSRFDFARAILAEAGLSPRLHRIATTELAAPARRPANSMLDCGRIAAAYGIGQPAWWQALADTVATLKGAA